MDKDNKNISNAVNELPLGKIAVEYFEKIESLAPLDKQPKNNKKGIRYYLAKLKHKLFGYTDEYGNYYKHRD